MSALNYDRKNRNYYSLVPQMDHVEKELQPRLNVNERASEQMLEKTLTTEDYFIAQWLLPWHTACPRRCREWELLWLCTRMVPVKAPDKRTQFNTPVQ